MAEVNSLGTTLVLLADLLLLLKVSEFIPDNMWLWRNGPKIARHLADDHLPSLDVIEKEGLLEQCPKCKLKIPGRPRFSFRFVGSVGLSLPWTAEQLSPSLIGAIKVVRLRLLWTPSLVVLAGLLVTFGHRNAPRLAVGISAVGFGVIACLTLLAAPLLRLSLGRFDTQFSDIGKISSAFEKRLPHENHDRETLAFYFLGLIGVSVLCYAMMYQGIDTAWPGSFGTDRGAPTTLSWLYLSAMTASTLGDDGMHAVGVAAQLGMMAQAITGPLIVFWLITILVDHSKR